MKTNEPLSINEDKLLLGRLHSLKLKSVVDNYQALAKQAAEQHWPYVEYLAKLIEIEAAAKCDRATERRIKQARFPVIKTLDSFQWSWPKKINQLQVKDFFRLKFIEDKSNIIFIGGVGVGKTHLAAAIGYAACLQTYSVLFASAIDIINNLSAAHNAGRLKSELKKYTRPLLLIIDELGYLPIDKKGADLLFQVINGRYEQGAIILTTNKPFKKWPEIFNNDSTLTSAVLDRLLHHAEAVVIEGTSYRMKDQFQQL